MGADASPPPRARQGMDLDSIRAKLRERGYLGGVAGWVASARAGGWVRYSVWASLRAAAVGGPLLALPAAAAIALANRPHLSAVRDLVVLWLYLAIVLGTVLALLEFATDVVLAAIARTGVVLVGRAERLAGRAGLLFTAATTLYLAFHLRGGRAGWNAPPAEPSGNTLAWLAWGAALIAALGIGHLVGRLTRAGSLVAMLASGAHQPIEPAPRAKRRAIAALGALLLLAVAAAVVFSGVPAREAAPATIGMRALPKLPSRPTPGRITLLGIDGLGAELFDAAAADPSRHPHLARLRSEGAVFPLARRSGGIPPSVWTSIATGRPADEHGVLAYSAERIWGMSAPVQPAAGPAENPFVLSPRLLWPPMHPSPGPVDATLRRAPALWEVFDAAGIASASINWWATWPAVQGGGIVVSDRALLRMLAGASLDRDVWPPALQDELEGTFEQTRSAAAASAGRIEEAGDAALARRAALSDAWHALVALRILEERPAPRILMLYLPGLDIVRGGSGTTWILSHLDEVAGRLMAAAAPDDLLLLAGDPGRKAEAFPQAKGIFVAWGAGAPAPGRVVPGEGPPHRHLDVAPTLLALAGVPLALDLPGRPILGFLRPGDPAASEGGTVATYGVLSADSSQESDPMDAEVLDRLRSLGYIQ